MAVNFLTRLVIFLFLSSLVVGIVFTENPFFSGMSEGPYEFFFNVPARVVEILRSTLMCDINFGFSF